MPIFEFECQSCNKEFELLVGLKETPVCPECSSVELEKLMSTSAGRMAGKAALPMAGDCPPPQAGPCGPGCCRLP